MDAEEKLITKSQAVANSCIADAVNEATEKYSPTHNFDAWVNEIGKKFIEKKIDSFPMMCDVARMQNYLKWKELEEFGYKGKFSGKAGFSQSGNMVFKYEIPRELYMFMVNLVYIDFWSNDNKPIADKFMKKIIRGDDPMQVLMWVKSIYGSNAQKSIVS